MTEDVCLPELLVSCDQLDKCVWCFQLILGVLATVEAYLMISP